MSYTLDFDLMLTAAGYSDLRAQIYDTSGTNVGSAVSTGFTDIGSGFYHWHYTAIPDGHRGGVKFYRTSGSTTILGTCSINSQEAEFVDVVVSSIGSSGSGNPLLSEVPGTYASGTAGYALGRLGNGMVNVIYPITSTNLLTIVRGDDYSATDGRALDWTDVDAQWPELTSGSVEFTGKKVTRDCTLTVTGSVVTATGTNKKVRAEPTATQTSVLLVGDYNYDVQVTLPNGHKVTLVADSPMKVLEDYST